MTYVFMAIHYPEPGRQADLYRRMADLISEPRGAAPPGLRSERRRSERRGKAVPQESAPRRAGSMAESIRGVSGLIDIGPWVEHDGERVVGVSRWESREAFEAAMPGSGVPSITVHEWEARPREYLHLTQPARQYHGPGWVMIAVKKVRPGDATRQL